MEMKLVRLSDLIEQIRGISYKPSFIRQKGDPNAIGLLRANNIKNNILTFDDLIYVSKI